MSVYNTFAYKAYVSVMTKIGDFNWNNLKTKITGKRYYNLTDDDLNYLRKALASNYYIISTRRKTVLSTYLIGFATLVKTGTVGNYDHVLMNLEGDNPKTDADYQLLEATAKGVHISSFMEVFDCDSVVLLRPKNMTVEEWEKVVEAGKANLGKAYDDLFNLNDSSRVSCVELVRDALEALPDYSQRFPNFEAAIKKYGNLTPQMYYDCPDFEKVWEVRR